MELLTDATGVPAGVGVGRVAGISTETGVFVGTGSVIAGGCRASEECSETCPIGVDVKRVISSTSPRIEMMTTSTVAAA
jgi:hypothetical protein